LSESKDRRIVERRWEHIKQPQKRKDIYADITAERIEHLAEIIRKRRTEQREEHKSETAVYSVKKQRCRHTHSRSAAWKKKMAQQHIQNGLNDKLAMPTVKISVFYK